MARQMLHGMGAGAVGRIERTPRPPDRGCQTAGRRARKSRADRHPGHTYDPATKIEASVRDAAWLSNAPLAAASTRSAMCRSPTWPSTFLALSRRSASSMRLPGAPLGSTTRARRVPSEVSTSISAGQACGNNEFERLVRDDRGQSRQAHDAIVAEHARTLHIVERVRRQRSNCDETRGTHIARRSDCGIQLLTDHARVGRGNADYDLADRVRIEPLPH